MFVPLCFTETEWYLFVVKKEQILNITARILFFFQWCLDGNTHTCYSVCNKSFNMSVGCGCTVDGREAEEKDSGDRTLSLVMALCLSGLLCAASLSLITGCDGIHQHMPTE